MKKFSFEEAKSIGNSISPEELKKIKYSPEDYRCICEMQIGKKPFYTSPVPDAESEKACKEACKTMCSKNKYCDSVMYCYDKDKGCGSGSGSWIDCGSDTGSDACWQPCDE